MRRTKCSQETLLDKKISSRKIAMLWGSITHQLPHNSNMGKSKTSAKFDIPDYGKMQCSKKKFDKPPLHE